MKKIITLPTSVYNKYFSNIFLSKIFSNMLYHFGSREKSADIFIKLLEKYYINKQNIEYPNFVDYRVNSLIKETNLGNGFIVATSHYGAFPFIPFLIAEFFKKNVAIIVLEHGAYYIDEIKSHYDMSGRKNKVYLVELSDRAKLFSIINILKAGHIVLIYSDANYSQKGTNDEDSFVRCNFLGHQIKTKSGFSKLSYLTGLPIVFAFMENKNNIFNLNISDNIVISKNEKSNNFKNIVQRFYSGLEEYVSNAPEYWFMWNLFNDLIIRDDTKNENNGLLNYDCYKMKFNLNKFFCFELKDDFFLHVVNKFSNVKINHSFLEIIENLSHKNFTMREFKDYIRNTNSESTQIIEKTVPFLIQEEILQVQE